MSSLDELLLPYAGRKMTITTKKSVWHEIKKRGYNITYDEFVCKLEELGETKSKKDQKMAIIIVLIIIMGLAGLVTICARTDMARKELGSCSSMVEKQLSKGHIRRAKKVLFNYEGPTIYDDSFFRKSIGHDTSGIEDIAAMVIRWCTENNHIDDALDVYQHYNMHDGIEAKYIRDYYIKEGNYDTAETYAKYSTEHYFDFLETSVETMCKKGEQKEAEIFVMKKLDYFPIDKESPYNRKDVQNRLMKIINLSAQ